MMFLLRAAFWLSVVILLLPTGKSESSNGLEMTQSESQLAASDAVGVARTAISDLFSFCDRNPEACATGSAAFALLGQKAQDGAELVFDYLAELDPAHIAIGSPSDDPGEAAGDTLQPGDLDVPWRGPDIRS